MVFGWWLFFFVRVLEKHKNGRRGSAQCVNAREYYENHP